MEKVIFAALVAALTLAVGVAFYKEGSPTPTAKLAEEMCYQGVTYLKFGRGKFAVGSVKMLPDGKVATCKE